jgi:type II secretory ATPase GspE/PulE/Tfp pilus assembly ATPase PilB-like protein
MYDNQALYAALKELQVIDQTLLDEAFAASKQQNIPLGNILLDKNLISDDDLGKLVAQILQAPFVKLSALEIPQNILTIIPELIARKERIVAFKKDEKGIHVAMENPKSLAIISFLQNKLGLPLIVYYATPRDIENALGLYLQDIGKAFTDIMQESIKQAQSNKQTLEPPIIKIVETIISYAYKNNASDIHIEPEDEVCLVRFRIDGILHDVVQLPAEMYPEIVRRVKVLAKLRIDETQEPQDGKIEFTVDDRVLDIRLSTVPVKRGEKIVMRLLSERARQISLLTLGFAQDDLAKIESAYKKPYGAILATGPTGSGKTTTMYAILKLLNNRDVNIMTIEDPIEYDIEGVNQMQVNPKTNLTFAAGLRSILRQDPNIILVGEIRDEETADIAVNAAMTGHLVLSTLHTNDSATAIPRLFDMGIEPFLIASTVNVILAQRLVRKIHTVCRISEETTREKVSQYLDAALVEILFGENQTINLYRGKGCDICHHSGYEGRVGIFEVMLLNDAIKDAITSKQDASVIRTIAQKNGMRTMIEDGLEKVRSGDTTIEEVLRVTKE